RKLSGFPLIESSASCNGREVAIYDKTLADPTIEQTDMAALFALEFGAQAVVGIGGGSPLDTSKVVAARLTNAVPVGKLIGVDQVALPIAPLAVFPTTAGTGSEVTNVSILTDPEAGIKKAVVSNRIVPGLAGLLAELTLDLPSHITAATGMDALCHASEAFISRRQNAYSDAMALAALPLIAQNLPLVMRNPHNLESRQQMLQASLLAGLAFNNSSVTAIHAFAYPLGGRFHVAHGLANSLMFGAIMRHNQVVAQKRFALLARVFDGGSDFIASVEALRATLPLPQNLCEAGIPADALEGMANDVMSVTRLLSVNPREITRVDAGRIYREAFATP
ncbi:MAG TPA: iron-containing alcohol dehydrogenase, partial [Fibrobacteraceae bacterium]|nr:iron-containing alcohol dehydrogenase [Fibrobacteraceae bacterium]